MAGSGASPNVLVVEDDFHIAHHIARSLMRQGCTVLGPAPNQHQALALMASKTVDFAILDLNLGGALAFPVAAALRDARVPFVFATGYSPTSIPPSYRDVPVWVKPFRVEDLTTHIPDLPPDTRELGGSGLAGSNLLLRTIDPADAAELRPHMSRVALGRDFSPERERILAFPECGLCSLTVASGERPGFEIAMVGSEGVLGAQVWSSASGLPLEYRWLHGAEAVVIAVEPFSRVLARSERLQRTLAEFRRNLAVQMAWNAYAAGCLAVDRRLARWILMTADRIGDHVSVTHADIATALGVRRAGVTVSMHILEGEGMVRSTRSLVTVRSRAALERFVGRAYGETERAYRDLISSDWRPGQGGRA